MDIVRNSLKSLARLPAWAKAVLIAIVVIAIGLGVHFLTRAAPAPAAASAIPHVTIESVSSLAGTGGALSVVGKVTSVSQASILAQSSGEIVSLNHALGDRVSAGSVIATFENSSQQAAVLQAQGAYAAAQAALAKASGSTAANSSVSSASAATAAANAATAASSALRSAYVSLDDAIHTKADALLSNPSSDTPQLKLTVPDSQLVIDIQNERTTLDALISGVGALATTTAGSDVDAHVTSANAALQTAEAYLDDLAQALNKAVPSQSVSASAIATYQASIAAARSEVTAAVTGITSAKSAYDAAVSGATTATNSANAGTANDIAAAEANVKSAQGALDAAEANLEKTIVRAPISGTIVSLSVKRGDFVSSFSPVAVISNPSALEVDAYVTSADAKTLASGAAASIGSTASGTITFIAPALDPSTGKIQVKIGITKGASALTDGDSVSVLLGRRAESSKGAPAPSAAGIMIPLAAAKITPEGPVVFTVASSTLVSNPITFGAISGTNVTVTAGLTPDMAIVTDARGLSAGEQVVVDPE